MSRPIRTQSESLGFRALPAFGADRRPAWLIRLPERAALLGVGAVLGRLILG